MHRRLQIGDSQPFVTLGPTVQSAETLRATFQNKRLKIMTRPKNVKKNLTVYTARCDRISPHMVRHHSLPFLTGPYLLLSSLCFVPPTPTGVEIFPLHVFWLKHFHATSSFGNVGYLWHTLIVHVFHPHARIYNPIKTLFAKGPSLAAVQTNH